MTTVVNVRTHAAPSLYIGRRVTSSTGKLYEASDWANPHKITSDTPINRANALAAYLAHLQRRRDLWLALHELRDQTLACWCHPKPCHGHVLADLANALTDHGKPCPRCKTPLLASLISTTTPGHFKAYARCPSRHCAFYVFRPAFRISTPFFSPSGGLLDPVTLL